MEPWIIDGEQQEDDDGVPCWAGFHPEYWGEAKWFSCPYGKPGDRLWVRETWAEHFGEVRYRASEAPDGYYHGAKGWRPSIFMPRAYSRVTLQIVGVRVERVCDISHADALAEGVADADEGGNLINGSYAITNFANLWEKINDKRGYGWASNPWVWVVKFQCSDFL